MYSLHSVKLTFIALGFFAIGACSNSNETGGEVDTRPTMAQFMLEKPEPQVSSFALEDIDNSIQAANRAAISFAQNQMGNIDNNNVIVALWPMFSTLALADLASQGETADEIKYELKEFGLDKSWHQVYQALYQSQEDLLTSGVTRIDHDLWAQYNSQFESEFLIQIDAALQPQYHSTNFAAGEDIATAVDQAIVSSLVKNYTFSIESYANTRLLALSQTKTVGQFDVNGLQIDTFEGLFENNASELIRAPMIHVQGNMGFYESSELLAYQIPIESNKLSLISIQPKEGASSYILNNLEIVLSDLNNAWLLQEASAVLPALSVSFGVSGGWLSGWKNIHLLYSEELADLRNMDYKGGLYMQGMSWDNYLSLSEQGVEIASVSGHVSSFSEHNIFAPGNNNGSHGAVLISINPSHCNEVMPEPDLSAGFIIIQNTVSGLIQSVLSFNTLAGVVEGRTDCIPHFLSP
jgi:serine protease inhibitor